MFYFQLKARYLYKVCQLNRYNLLVLVLFAQPLHVHENLFSKHKLKSFKSKNKIKCFYLFCPFVPKGKFWQFFMAKSRFFFISICLTHKFLGRCKFYIHYYLTISFSNTTSKTVFSVNTISSSLVA